MIGRIQAAFRGHSRKIGQSGLIRLQSTTKKPSNPPAHDPSAESFLTGTSSGVIEDLYIQWQQNPLSVTPEWASYFRNVEAGMGPGNAYPRFNPALLAGPTQGMGAIMNFGARELQAQMEEYRNVLQMIRAYRVRGHLLADLDPLRMNHPKPLAEVPDLNPASYGFSEADMDRVVYVGEHMKSLPSWTKLSDLLQHLRDLYCKKVGVEYYHISDRQQRQYIEQVVERDWPAHQFTPDQKRKLFLDLVQAEGFENYLKTKFRLVKRFGLEGGEALIPGMRALLDAAGSHNIEHICSGMAHRGRLNYLVNVINKPFGLVFRDFTPTDEMMKETDGSGDVKYHLGTAADVETSSGNVVHLSLAANPSHLEAVNPVVEGKTRAKQYYLKDFERKRVMSVLIHGDAAFAGQGVVYETLHLSDLPAYSTGGTVHVILNNQIGFTTDPKVARSSPYPSDVAKAIQAPILHVNGDDPEAVVRAFNFAVAFRQAYHRDVVIDLICYRLHGHNEIDNPRFTQPHMYDRIESHPRPSEVYEKQLIAEGVITAEWAEEQREEFRARLDKEHKQAHKAKMKEADWLSNRWEGIVSWRSKGLDLPTGLPLEELCSIGKTMTDVPEDMTLHKLVQNVVDGRRDVYTGGDSQALLDWGNAEHLAFATLLNENYSVRLSGQDVQRGTFSHRHAVLHDQKIENYTLTPLQRLNKEGVEFHVYNSSLSEFAAMGFELGYSLSYPDQLVMWEAQFGDFANGAQVIIDQFLSSGEAKWLRQSGLTLLLPHGYDGQGPEHSSARLERFLQLCDGDPDTLQYVHQKCNMQVVYPTMPANLFHVLRRQVKRNYRKPLVVFVSKRLMRYKDAKSPLSDFGEGTVFSPVIGEVEEERLAKKKDVERVVFCTGQVYFDILERRRKRMEEESEDKTKVAIVRLEELHPFPYKHIQTELKKYPNAQVVWAQEEPQNMGSWSFVEPRFNTLLENLKAEKRCSYRGRPPSASPATGFKAIHDLEQNKVAEGALGFGDESFHDVSTWDNPYQHLFPQGKDL